MAYTFRAHFPTGVVMECPSLPVLVAAANREMRYAGDMPTKFSTYEYVCKVLALNATMHDWDARNGRLIVTIERIIAY